MLVLPADLALLNAWSCSHSASSPCSKVGNLPPPIGVDDRQTEPIQTDPARASTARVFNQQHVCALTEKQKTYPTIGLVQAQGRPAGEVGQHFLQSRLAVWRFQWV